MAYQHQPGIPDWVPAGVMRTASVLAQSCTEDFPTVLALIERLLFDPRMKAVWHELTKRKRHGYVSTDEPFHPSRLPKAVESWENMAEAERSVAAGYQELGGQDIAADHARRAKAAEARHQRRPARPITQEQQHELAYAMVFARAVSLYCESLKTVTQKEVKQHIEALRANGQDEMAAAYERQFKTPEVARYVVRRRRTDPRLEAFIEGLAALTRKLFGQPLHGVIAIVTNVAFDRTDFDRERVRAILKGPH
jgi:hypothetical protein